MNYQNKFKLDQCYFEPMQPKGVGLNELMFGLHMTQERHDLQWQKPDTPTKSRRLGKIGSCTSKVPNVVF